MDVLLEYESIMITNRQKLSVLIRVHQTVSHIHTYIYLHTYTLYRRRDNAVGLATGYGLDDRGIGVLVQVESRIFSSSRHANQFWGPPNLLYNWYWD
jgi:hypothetical protein